jgi:hypothetical protein
LKRLNRFITMILLHLGAYKLKDFAAFQKTCS